MKKKYIAIVVIIFLIIFCFLYYIFFINGNNNFKKSKDEIIENILTEKLNYKSEIEVTIYSNKNENVYRILQEETNESSFLEVISKGDIEGLVIEYQEGKLILKNTKLNLEKIFEEYKEFSGNYLFLNTFINDYIESENKKLLEDEENYLINIEIKNSNKYIKYKELYIDKKTGKPNELIIKNSDKQVVVCIKYISIEIFQ